MTTELTAADREALAGLSAEFAQHRQEHDPDTGASHCACGGWSGPFTMYTGPGSYADHLAAIVTAHTDDLRAELAATRVRLAAARLALDACAEVRESRAMASDETVALTAGGSV